MRRSSFSRSVYVRMSSFNERISDEKNFPAWILKADIWAKNTSKIYSLISLVGTSASSLNKSTLNSYDKESNSNYWIFNTYWWTYEIPLFWSDQFRDLYSISMKQNSALAASLCWIEIPILTACRISRTWDEEKKIPGKYFKNRVKNPKKSSTISGLLTNESRLGRSFKEQLISISKAFWRITEKF